MRLVLQRVSRARVTVDGEVTGEIGHGLLALVGIGERDTENELDQMAHKTVNLRIFEDDQHHMNRSLLEAGGSILAVSQFTLYANCRKGRRPSFIEAARPDVANDLFERFVERLRALGVGVETGVFAAMMDVELCNAGPVTIILDSDDLKAPR